MVTREGKNGTAQGRQQSVDSIFFSPLIGMVASDPLYPFGGTSNPPSHGLTAFIL